MNYSNVDPNDMDEAEDFPEITSKDERFPVQIAAAPLSDEQLLLFALANDGTLWQMCGPGADDWHPVRALPQPEQEKP
jgi:hypothetical protein